jgi:hypothetical protein
MRVVDKNLPQQVNAANQLHVNTKFRAFAPARCVKAVRSRAFWTLTTKTGQGRRTIEAAATTSIDEYAPLEGRFTYAHLKTLSVSSPE